MRKLPTRKLLVTLVAGALLIPDIAFTLGLGEIEVNSALNQKLNADIELLTASPEDVENIIINLASRKEFSRAGLDRPYQLSDLRFKSEVIDGVPHIKVSSGSPIREPFLNFLIEIDWPNGHLLREYTVLLDPPVFMTKAARTISRPSDSTDSRPGASGSPNVVPVAGSSSIPSATGQMPQASNSQVSNSLGQTPVTHSYAPAPVVAQQTNFNQPAGSYRIKRGDTTWSLADALRPDQSISVEQMMIAMLRANPESFIDENINGLKRGYILRIPDFDQIASLSQQEARAIVREHAALWRQFQQSQATAQPVSAMPADGDTVSADAGDVAAVEQNSAYLEIVSAGGGSSDLSAKNPGSMSAEELRTELAFARERVETEKVEKEALQQRVDALQQSVDGMKGLLSIENDGLSGVQALGSPVEGSTTEGALLEEDLVEAAEAEMAESISETDDLLAEQSLDDAIAEETAGETAEGESVDQVYAEDVSAEMPESGEDAVFVDEASVEGDEAIAGMPEAAEQAEPVRDDAPPPVANIPPADPLTRLLNDPMLLAAAGGGLLLILAVFGLINKRRKAAAESATVSAFDELEDLTDEVDSETKTVAEDESSAEDDFASDSAATLDPAEDTIVSEADASEEDKPVDDVIAEADVYLAYGIYQQAVELLTQAISDNPDRDDYRLKLAETHYASKDAEAFIEVAGEIKGRVDSEDSSMWEKVMGMGQDLCADSPMFQGAEEDSPEVEEGSSDAAVMDFDLGTDADNSATPELDSESLGDNVLVLPGLGENNSADAVSNEAATEIETETLAEPVDEIEFDLSDTGAVEDEAVTEDEFSLDIDATELDIDIQEDKQEEASSDEVSIDLADIDIGLDDRQDSAEEGSDEIHEVADIDIDFGLEDAAETTAESVEELTEELPEELTAELAETVEELTEELPAEPTAELAETTEELTEELPEVPTAELTETTADSAEELTEELPADEQGISLDLAEEAASLDMDSANDEALSDVVKAAPDVAANELLEAEDDEDFDFSSIDDVDEISTKLDLARAYLDMGDHDGTRGILDEVLNDGNDEQKEEANELMAKLG